ncbi:MAG: hypothetical protein ACREEW_14240 [Caulobacteraceae bacterium]
MKRLAPVILAAAAALSLGACADGYYDTGPYAGGYVGGYYDNYYGPIYDGYWGPTGVFYYRTAHNGGYVADSGHHFRHDRGGHGYRSFHVHSGHWDHDRGH